MPNTEHPADRGVMDRALLVDDDGKSLWGSCSLCQRRVDNHDELHRVSAIVRGGRGVECVMRGDITFQEAMPLGRVNRSTARGCELHDDPQTGLEYTELNVADGVTLNGETRHVIGWLRDVELTDLACALAEAHWQRMSDECGSPTAEQWIHGDVA